MKNTGITLEKIAEGRWQARRNGIRIGIVLGGNRVYVAETPRGAFAGRGSTKMQAAARLGE
jgi:hypothetical protein